MENLRDRQGWQDRRAPKLKYHQMLTSPHQVVKGGQSTIEGGQSGYSFYISFNIDEQFNKSAQYEKIKEHEKSAEHFIKGARNVQDDDHKYSNFNIFIEETKNIIDKYGEIN